jgi:uncharacterized RDD family membrane protein YckC
MGTTQANRPSKVKTPPNPYAPKPEGWSPSGAPLKYRIVRRKLATRTSRLLAVLLDGLFGLIPYFIAGIVFFAAILFGTEGVTAYNIGYGTASILSFVYLVIQIESLARHAGTIGKRVMGIYIADFESGMPSTWVQNLLVRGILWGLLASLTLGILYIVDIFFLFREDQRCLHDLVAKTVVYERDKSLVKKAPAKKAKKAARK